MSREAKTEAAVTFFRDAVTAHLVRLRTNHDLSIRQAAILIGIPYSTMHYIEKGEWRLLSLDTIFPAIDYYGYSVEDFIADALRNHRITRDRELTGAATLIRP